MTVPKKILIVYPHNFYERESGVNTRFFEFISLLKEMGYVTDLLGLKHFKSSWKNFNAGNSNHLINRLFLYDFRIGYQVRRLLDFFSNRKNSAGRLLPDYAFPGMISKFHRILQRNTYDFVVIGYVYWANLLKENLPGNPVKVLTIEDFISQKLYEKSPGSAEIKDSIQEEITRVNLFDRVICLSHEEMKFFSGNALHPEYFFIPIFMARPDRTDCMKKYDILFIGDDNADNIEGLDWFFTKVFPLLSLEIKIVVVGKIARYAPDLPGVTKKHYVSGVGGIYPACKISINPLKQGTGMKVKVVESLAYGIPMVNTSRGLCGMPPGYPDQFIVADDPDGFAGEIMRLLTNQEWYEEQCLRAKKIFDEHFETNVVKKELNRIFSR